MAASFAGWMVDRGLDMTGAMVEALAGHVIAVGEDFRRSEREQPATMADYGCSSRLRTV